MIWYDTIYIIIYIMYHICIYIYYIYTTNIDWVFSFCTHQSEPPRALFRSRRSQDSPFPSWPQISPAPRWSEMIRDDEKTVGCWYMLHHENTTTSRHHNLKENVRKCERHRFQMQMISVYMFLYITLIQTYSNYITVAPHCRTLSAKCSLLSHPIPVTCDFPASSPWNEPWNFSAAPVSWSPVRSL